LLISWIVHIPQKLANSLIRVCIIVKLVFLTTHYIFHQDPTSRDILKSEYIVLFKNTKDKTNIVHLPRHVYPGNICSFHKAAWTTVETYNYLFLDLR